ncbi:MAG: hypothetical protein KAX40_01920 [Herpetosiphon sp.]|nr:hypothetical protein [Herpetosiphon sp.]
MATQLFDRVFEQAQRLTHEEQAQLIGRLACQLVVSRPTLPNKAVILQDIRQRIAAYPVAQRTAAQINASLNEERASWSRALS